MNLDRQRMVVKLHHIHLNLRVTVQEFLFEAAGHIGEFRHGHLVLSVNRDLHVIRSIGFRRHHTKALMSSPGFSKVLSLSELYLFYSSACIPVVHCGDDALRRDGEDVVGSQREFKLSHKLGEMVNDTAFELLRCSFELKKFTLPKSWSKSAIAFLSCTIFWVTVDAAASSL